MVQPPGLGTGPVCPEHATVFHSPEKEQGLLTRMKDGWLLGEQVTVLLKLLCHCSSVEARGFKLALDIFSESEFRNRSGLH